MIPVLDGSTLSPLMALPFLGILLSIAVIPLVLPALWSRYYGLIALGWSIIAIAGIAISQGAAVSLHSTLAVVIETFIPFIFLLATLFTITGGIKLHGDFNSSPLVNTAFLAIGALFSCVIGTTGAAVLLIRPILQSNHWRKYKVHTILFFIFLAGNIGGTLTPVGNPPLLIGFIQKVPFFWPTVALFIPTLVTTLILLAIYFVIETILFRREPNVPPKAATAEPFSLEGKINLLFVLLTSGAVLLQSLDLGEAFAIYHVPVATSTLLSLIAMAALAFLSIRFTSKETRQRNQFTWHPIQEVAILFAGIFVTMAPLIAMLKAGAKGPMSILITSLSRADGTPYNELYFWFSGLLSGFLDSAPAYLVFFQTAASGQADPAAYMTSTGVSTLVAISLGASFMGALSYIGNAPNMMIRAIAEERGVKMPSFFGYCGWAFLILIPLFMVVMFLFVR